MPGIMLFLVSSEVSNVFTLTGEKENSIDKEFLQVHASRSNSTISSETYSKLSTKSTSFTQTFVFQSFVAPKKPFAKNFENPPQTFDSIRLFGYEWLRVHLQPKLRGCPVFQNFSIEFKVRF